MPRRDAVGAGCTVRCPIRHARLGVAQRLGAVLPGAPVPVPRAAGEELAVSVASGGTRARRVLPCVESASQALVRVPPRSVSARTRLRVVAGVVVVACMTILFFAADSGVGRIIFCVGALAGLGQVVLAI